MVGPCYVVHFCNYLAKKERGLVYFNCVFMSFDRLYSVSLPHGAVGWSTVCDCGVS